MAKNTQLATSIANAQADYFAGQLDGGYLRIYAGSQPADADTALSGQTLIAELRFETPSAPSAVNGVITFDAPETTYALANGTATWFRALKSDGSTVVFDGTVGLAGDTPNLILSTVTINASDLIIVGSMSHSVLRAYTGL